MYATGATDDPAPTARDKLRNDVGNGDRPRSPRPSTDENEDLLRMFDGVRGGAEYAGLPGLSRVSRGVAGVEPEGGRAGDADGAGDGMRDSQPLDLCAEELLLS